MNISWTLVSFSIILPLSNLVRNAQTRRENAIHQMAGVRSYLMLIMQCHKFWDWKSTVKADKASIQSGDQIFDGSIKGTSFMRDRNKHIDDVRLVCSKITETIVNMLQLLTWSRARQTQTNIQNEEILKDTQMNDNQKLMWINCMNMLFLATEEIKRCGLPGNEAARVNNFIMGLTLNQDKLTRIKEYRTPQSMRSISRIWLIITPILYIPYLMYLQTSIGLIQTVMFNISVSFALESLHTAVMLLEDPFTLMDPWSGGYGIDSIDLVRWQKDINTHLDEIVNAKQQFLDQNEIIDSDDQLDKSIANFVI